MKILTLLRDVASIPGRLEVVRREIEAGRIALGRHESRRVRTNSFSDIREAEFQVFSQWGEDGIIQYLLGKVPIENAVFVEFGVEDYSESNTRFLLVNDNWRGLIIDGGTAHQRFLDSRDLGWRYAIQAVTAFITRDNIDALLRDGGVRGDIGLLSVDIDGNDYWVLEAITGVSPRILIVEYNSIFGPDLEVTIPYHHDFQRTRAHHSNLYYGASLAAVVSLAARKGYVFVGSNSVGSNAFFVRKDVATSVRSVSAAEGYVASAFRESRDEKGALTYVTSHRERLAVIGDLSVLELRSGETKSIRELYGLA